MPVDAAIDDEGRANHGVVARAARQPLGPERDFESAGHFKIIDPHPLAGDLGDLGGKSIARAIDDVAVPSRLDEGDATRGKRGLVGLGEVEIHGRGPFLPTHESGQADAEHHPCRHGC